METLRNSLPVAAGSASASRPLQGEGVAPAATGNTAGEVPSFQQLLEQELALRAVAETAKENTRAPSGARLRLSAHAEQRLRSGGVRWGPSEEARLAAAIDKVASKGGKQALVLMGDLALIVSITNRTVITAIPGERRQENVFTQIDSAVITS
ncbi:MAG: hypothetical protein IMX00_06890 [Limnochordales bacterium]|nr:hypothetical protein [Limnochordales bacterium]